MIVAMTMMNRPKSFFRRTRKVQKERRLKNEKEKQNLETKLNEAIREKEKLVKNLNINIIKYPKRYTEKALELNKNINELISSYSEKEEK